VRVSRVEKGGDGWMEVKGDEGRKLDGSKRWGLVLPEVSRAARIILAYLLADC
jgi:hypothetical protein